MGSYASWMRSDAFVFTSIFQIELSKGIAAQTYPEAAATPNTLALSFVRKPRGARGAPRNAIGRHRCLGRTALRRRTLELSRSPVQTVSPITASAKGLLSAGPGESVCTPVDVVNLVSLVELSLDHQRSP